MKYQRTVAGNSLTISDAFNQPVLSLREEDADGVMQITLEGEITADVSHEFEDELTSAATVCKHLELDFRNVSSICSTGLKALLTTQQFLEKQPDASFLLRNLRGSVLQVFRETGFIDLFDIEEQN